MSAWWDAVPEALGEAYADAVVLAVRAGKCDHEWQTVHHEGLSFEISRAPLAIDGRFCLGLSAHAVERIAEAMGEPVMLCTPKLWDLAAEDCAQKQIGPHTLPQLLGVQNGAAGMTKRAALAHSDAIAKQRGTGSAFISGACKTYVLDGRQQEGRACEYGWRLPSGAGWGSRNSSGTGYLVQPAQWAHAYRAFWDYSMGAIFVKRAAALHGEAVDLGALALAGRSIVTHKALPALTMHSKPSTSPAIIVAKPTAQTLRRGHTGDAVHRWQLALQATGYSLGPYGADGAFGKRTHNATVAFQRDRDLPATGVVDARTRAAVGTAPVAREVAHGITDTILSRSYRWANRTAVDWIVIHTIEAVEASYTANNVALWMSRDAPVSAHYCIDDDSTILCVPEEHIAWAAPGANDRGIQLEHAGFARQSLAEWEDAYSQRMLERSAWVTARACKRWDIPPRFVDAAAMLRGERGITTHREVSKGVGKGKTNHYDPGPHFPMGAYVERAQALTGQV